MAVDQLLNKISKLEKIIDSLRVSEERYALTVQGSCDGLWDLPVLENNAMWWSPRIYELLGYEDGEIEASIETLFTLIPPDDIEKIKQAISDLIKNETPYHLEHRVQRKSGEFRWFLSRCMAVRDSHGRVVRLSGSIHDITQQKEAIEGNRILNEKLEQQVLERTKELQESLDNLRSPKDQLGIQKKQTSWNILTNGIAHELKNPLNLVINLSDISAELCDEIQEALEASPKVKAISKFDQINENLESINRIAKTIHKHGIRANEIINNVLEHSRNEKPLLDLADVNRLLEKCLNYSIANYQSKKVSNKHISNIIVDKTLDESIEMIELFSQDISKVLLNILKNALDTLEEKSKINEDHYSPELKVTTENRENTIVIKIRDNGMGISKENKYQIFDTFFTTKPSSQRVGLGLSLSQEIIVREHGGQLDFRTEEGQFTEFVITLPKKK